MTASPRIVAALLWVGVSACAGGTRSQTGDERTAASAAQPEALAAAEARAQRLEAQLEAAQRELAQVTETRDSLERSREREIRDGEIEVSQLRDELTLKLRDKVLFASGSTQLSPEGRAVLDVVADAVKGLLHKDVVVAGHTDDVPLAPGGPYRDNWELSTGRAIAVVRYLASRGVPPHMLAAAGFSKYRPLAPNDTAENRGLNRRIEIALTPAEYAPEQLEATALRDRQRVRMGTGVGP